MISNPPSPKPRIRTSPLTMSRERAPKNGLNRIKSNQLQHLSYFSDQNPAQHQNNLRRTAAQFASEPPRSITKGPDLIEIDVID